MGVVHGIQSFLPHIKAHGEDAHILNTASLAGMACPPGTAPYNASKFAADFVRWPVATEIHVRWHVGGQGNSGLVVLNVSFVARDPGCVKTRKIEMRRELHSSVRLLS
jgi:NAD(P)-dependent dehydrogenase (short-subunit alcohol dehydrogenase family)